MSDNVRHQPQKRDEPDSNGEVNENNDLIFKLPDKKIRLNNTEEFSDSSINEDDLEP